MKDSNRVTPPKLFEVLDAQFEFEIDVAATARNALCDRYIGLRHLDPMYRDALNPRTRWCRTGHRRVFCNPPWKTPHKWMEKACIEAQKHPNNLCLVLLPTGTGQGREIWRQKASLIIHLIGRPQFISKSGANNSSNMYDIVLYVYRRDIFGFYPQTVYLDWKKL